ncbi:alpha/beta hydrolase [Spirillospora sp. NPDC047418]
MPERTDHFWSSTANVPSRTYWKHIDGVSTRILEFGEAGAPPLIMVHGTGGHAEAFVHNAAALAERHRVILYDLPAHGWSSAPERAYEIADYLTHLEGITEELGISDLLLCGQSLGGWIAGRFAARNGARVRRLVLVGAGGLDSDVSRMWAVRKQSLDAVQHATEASVRRRLEAIMGRPEHATDELVHCRMAIYSQADAGQRMDYALRLQDPAVRSRNLLRPEELGRISCPTLVLSGDADRIVPPRTSLRLSRYIPDASYAEISMAGHWPQFEQPDVFNELVLAFLDTDERTEEKEAEQ